MKKDSGFTLIELLVVIAIIGILASVVLASINSARNKAIDKALQGNMLSVQNQALLFYDTYKAYGPTFVGETHCASGMFNSDPIMNAALTKMRTYAIGYDELICFATDETYAVVVKLKSIAGYYCLDSVGNRIVTTNAKSFDGMYGPSNDAAVNTLTGLCSN